MKKYILGIDLGTSSVKVGALNLGTLKLERVAGQNYDAGPEQASEVLWSKTQETIKIVCDSISNGVIEAIGVAGQMHGTVLYGERGQILGPVINWQDERCNRPLRKYGGKTTIDCIMSIFSRDEKNFENLGIARMASGFLGATLFYIKENNKTLFSKIRHVGLPTDFIRGKLLGKNDYRTDQTNACGTGLFDVRHGKWATDFFEALGLPYKIFPSICNASDIAGYTTNKSATLGLGKGIPIIVGGGDNQMSALGSGLVSPSSPILVNIGTASQISKVIAQYKKLPGTQQGWVPDTRSFFSQNYLLVGASLGGGKNYKWLIDTIRSSEKKGTQQGWVPDFAALNANASNVPPGSGGLKFCGGPSRNNPNRKMGFYGNLILKQNLGYMARAVIEAGVWELFQFYKLFGTQQDWVPDDSKTIIAGGGCILKNLAYQQILADMFGKTVMLADYENVVFGAAIMAGLGIGKIKNLSDVFKRVEYKKILPSPEATEKYRRLFTKTNYY